MTHKPQTADELPKQPPKKLNRKKLLKLAESISKDMESQTADEVFGVTGIPIPKEEYVKLANEVREIKDREYLGSDV